MSMVDSGGLALPGQDLPVVEADDCHLAWNVNACLVQCVQHATRNLVGAGEDRIELGVLLEQHPGRAASPRLGPRAEVDLATSQRKPGVLEFGQCTLRAVLRCAERRVAGDVGDLPATAGDQVLDSEPPRTEVVSDEGHVVRMVRRRVRVHHRDRQVSADRWPRVTPRRRSDRGWRAA
jgi:hypothetical protein